VARLKRAKAVTAETVNDLRDPEHLGRRLDPRLITKQNRHQATQAYALFNGRSKAPLVWAVPDAAYPGLYRIRSPDGRLSDLANLTRIKDAARVLCERGPPPRDARPPVRQKGRAGIQAVTQRRDGTRDATRSIPAEEGSR
jgi:hypothetical protein